jgi:hypothetical protein
MAPYLETTNCSAIYPRRKLKCVWENRQHTDNITRGFPAVKISPVSFFLPPVNLEPYCHRYPDGRRIFHRKSRFIIKNDTNFLKYLESINVVCFNHAVCP